jgi:ATP-dependent DNA ligase
MEDGCSSLQQEGVVEFAPIVDWQQNAQGDLWLLEIKYDGYRVQLHTNDGKKRVFSRNGLDWTKRFSVIAGGLDIPGQAIIDREVVVVHETRTDFSKVRHIKSA